MLEAAETAPEDHLLESFGPCDVARFKTWKSVLADAASESFPESVVDGQNIKTTFDFSLMHLKRRSVVWAEKATPRSEQNRPPEVGKHASWESDEDFARLVTQAQVVLDADKLFISHAMHQPRVCDTVDEQTIFDLDEEDEAEEEEEEDEGAAKPSSSSVAPPTGAAIKH